MPDSIDASALEWKEPADLFNHLTDHGGKLGCRTLSEYEASSR